MNYVIPIAGAVPDYNGTPQVFEGTAPLPPGALPLVSDTKPAFDAATQKVVFAGLVIEASQVRRTWQVVALTQTELDAISQASEAAIIRPAIAMFKAGTATNAQIQRALAYLLKQSLG